MNLTPRNNCTPEAVVLLLKAVSEERDAFEEQLAALREAVEFALHYKDIFRDYLKMRDD